MTDLQPLLKRLSELQPNLCKQIHRTWYQVQIGNTPFSIELESDEAPLQQRGLAYLLRAIVLALPPELIVQTKHDLGRWTVTLLDTEMPARFSEANEDMAIALTKVFIDWLEFGHDDPAADAAGGAA